MTPKPVGKGPRGPSAYMLFANEQRAAVAAELKAAGGKAGVGEVGKAMGERWGALTDEDKQRYKDLAVQKAAERQEQLEAAAAAAVEAGGSPGSEGGEARAAEAPHEGEAGAGAAPPPFGLPTSLVKKIAMVDPDVSRISADAVRALAKATELFVGGLALKALDHAVAAKRKNFKFEDVAAVARRDRRCMDMGLPDVLARDPAFAPVHEHAAEENDSRAAKAQKRRREAEEAAATKNVQQIIAFFKAAPAAAEAAAVPPAGAERAAAAEGSG
eukprot:scaffold1.g5767.t1